MVSEYTGLNIREVNDLPYVLYYIYKRDAWIFNQRQSKEGQELLKELYLLQQNEADYEKISEVSIKH